MGEPVGMVNEKINELEGKGRTAHRPRKTTGDINSVRLTARGRPPVIFRAENLLPIPVPGRTK